MVSTISKGRDLVFAGEIFDGNSLTVAKEAESAQLTHTFDFPMYYAITEGFAEQETFENRGRIDPGPVLPLRAISTSHFSTTTTQPNEDRL